MYTKRNSHVNIEKKIVMEFSHSLNHGLKVTYSHVAVSQSDSREKLSSTYFKSSFNWISSYSINL